MTPPAMYAGDDLEKLLAKKRQLRQRIAERREDSVLLAGRVAETIAIVDDWRQRLAHWTGWAAALFPVFRARSKAKAEGKGHGFAHWASLGWKLVKNVAPMFT